MNAETTKIETLKAHLALNVRNVPESIEFYKKMLGLEPSKVRVGYAKFDVQNPPLNLTLNQVPFGERGALSHLGIQVATTADVLAMREQWHERGLLTRDEMQTDCCYAMQDKTWTRDPDGNEWEVFVVLEGNLPETAEQLESSACCAPAVSAGTIALEADSSCACETVAPAEGVAACCETQAVKFDVETVAQSGSCCAHAPVGINQ